LARGCEVTSNSLEMASVGSNCNESEERLIIIAWKGSYPESVVFMGPSSRLSAVGLKGILTL